MRIFLYLFLFIFLNNFIGYYPLFLYMQQQVKQEIKQRIKNSIPREDLTVFSFSETGYKNIDWFEEDEFYLDGDMYDVVSKKTDRKGNIVVYAINDKKEKELLTDFEGQTRENAQDPTAEDDMQKTLKLFSNPISELIYFIPEKPVLPSLGYQSSFLSFVREILPPPPKLV